MKQNLKLLVVLLLLFTLIFPPAALADQTLEEELRNNDKYKGASPFERMISGVFSAIIQSAYKLLGLRDPLELIFDYEPMIHSEEYRPRNELILGIFDENDGSLISNVYVSLMKYTPILLTIILACTGLYLMFINTTGESRYQGKEILQGVIAGMVALAVGPYLIDTCFDVIYAGVEVFKNMVDQAAAARGMSTPKSLIGVMLSGILTQQLDADITSETILALSDVTVLGYVLIFFVIFISAGILNWQYFTRKLMIAILIIIFPIVAMFSVFPTRRQMLQIWVNEFLTNASLVFFHAVTYTFFILIFLIPDRTAFGVFEIVVYALGLTSISTYIRSFFFGAKASHIGSNSGAAALGTLMMIARMGNRKASSSISNYSPDKTPKAEIATNMAIDTPTPNMNMSEAGNMGGMGSPEASVSENTPSYQTSSTSQVQYNLSRKKNTGSFSFEGPNEPIGNSLGGSTFENISESNFKYADQEKTTEPENRSYKSSQEPANSPTGQNKEIQRNNNWSKGARVATVGAGVLAGGLLSGAVTGNAVPGMTAGGKASEYINRGIFTIGEHFTPHQIKQKSQDHSKDYSDINSNYKNTSHNYNNMNQASTTQINMRDLIRQHRSKGDINGYEWRP